MGQKTPSNEKTNSGNVQPSDELSPVITVDWAAVEEESGTSVGDDLRRVIEHTGSANSYTLDKWGYANASTVALYTAIKNHGRIIHPKRGPLDARYAPLRNMSAAISTLRKLQGTDLNIGTVIEDGDDKAFVDGLGDLYDAARSLDERRDDWRDGEHPAISFGSYGPDKLGSHYVHVGHGDQEIIEEIDVSDLPIVCEHVLAHGQRSYSGTDEHYTASFRHGRYYPKEESGPTEADKQAAEIGFLGANAGKTSIEQEFERCGFDYRTRDAPDVDGIHRVLTLYEYENEDEDETRCAIEWTQRIAIDDYVIRSLIFDHEPTESEIQTALLIEDRRQVT